MKKGRGQGTFEYILLLAGVLLIVVLAIVLLRGGIFQTSQANIQKDVCKTALVQSSACYDANGGWNQSGYIPTSQGHACYDFRTGSTPNNPNCLITPVQFGDWFEEPAGPGPSPPQYFCCAQKPV